MEQNYVAVVPMKIDFTDNETMKKMQDYDFAPEAKVAHDAEGD